MLPSFKPDDVGERVTMFWTLYCQLLGKFAKLRETTIGVVMSVRLSVRQHWKTGLPLNGFLKNLVFEHFSKICPEIFSLINHLNPELNPNCYLLTLLAHHFLHVSRITVKSLTLRLLMSYIYKYIYIYIYGAPILDVSRSHTTTQHSR